MIYNLIKNDILLVHIGILCSIKLLIVYKSNNRVFDNLNVSA